jgi:hypothetical protein
MGSVLSSQEYEATYSQSVIFASSLLGSWEVSSARVMDSSSSPSGGITMGTSRTKVLLLHHGIPRGCGGSVGEERPRPYPRRIFWKVGWISKSRWLGATGVCL